jgi:hypothetical protein
MLNTISLEQGRLSRRQLTLIVQPAAHRSVAALRMRAAGAPTLPFRLSRLRESAPIFRAASAYVEIA